MKDLLLNEAGDLSIINGDLVIGDSDEQHREIILITQPGSFKESPDVGVGLENFLNDASDELAQTVKEQFAKDGNKNIDVSYDNLTGQLNYNAEYSS